MGFLDVLKTLGKAASFIPGPQQPFVAGGTAALGVLDSLTGEGGGGGGGIGGGLGQTAAMGGLGLLMSRMLDERQKQRQAQEEALNARQQLLTRQLGQAEQVFADKAPLRNMGLGSLASFFSGQDAPSAFFGGGAAAGADPFATLGSMMGGLRTQPRSGSLLFPTGSGGGFGEGPSLPPLSPPSDDAPSLSKRDKKKRRKRRGGSTPDEVADEFEDIGFRVPDHPRLIRL